MRKTVRFRSKSSSSSSKWSSSSSKGKRSSSHRRKSHSESARRKRSPAADRKPSAVEIKFDTSLDKAVDTGNTLPALTNLLNAAEKEGKSSRSRKSSEREKHKELTLAVMEPHTPTPPKLMQLKVRASSFIKNLSSLLRLSSEVPPSDVEKLMKKVSVASMTIWFDPLVKENELLTSLLTKTDDPRKNLKEKCIFVGKADATTNPDQILSYTLPGSSTHTLCFLVPELKGVIENKAGREMMDMIKRKVPDDMKQDIPDDMSDEWTHSILLHAHCLDIHDREIKKSVDVTIFNRIMAYLMQFLNKRPIYVTIGTIVGRIKSFIPNWVKSVFSSPRSLFDFILHNPFMVNFVVLLSKGVRAILCAFMTGVTGKEFSDVIRSLWATASVSTVGVLITELVTVIYSCMQAGLSVSLFKLLDCVKSLFDAVVKMGLRIPANILSFISEFTVYLLTTAWNTTIAPFVHMFKVDPATTTKLMRYMNPVTWADWFMGRDVTTMKKVEEIFLNNFNETFFWGVLLVVPSRYFGVILDYIDSMLPDHTQVQNAKAFVKKVLEKELWKKTTVGELILILSDYRHQIYDLFKVLNEVYAWVVDVAGCFIMKLYHTLVSKLPYVEHDKTAVPGDCCFSDLIKSLSKPEPEKAGVK